MTAAVYSSDKHILRLVCLARVISYPGMHKKFWTIHDVPNGKCELITAGESVGALAQEFGLVRVRR